MNNHFSNKRMGLHFILLWMLFLLPFSVMAGTPVNEPINPVKSVTEPAFVKGELLVKFNKSNKALNTNAIKIHNVSVEKYYPHVGDIALLKITDKNVSVKEMIERLKQEYGDLIEYAEPNYKVHALNRPNDTWFDELWGVHNAGQTGGTSDADIDAVEAWGIATDASSIVVAVIDSGVDYTHQDLVSNMWVNPGEIAGDGVDNDGNGHIDDIYGIDTVNNDSDPMDDNNHGTHVSGIIGGTGNNSTGITGVAWNVKIMALKFLDSEGDGSTAGAIAALNYAVDMKLNHGINLVLTNNSWGGGGYSQALKDSIEASGDANMLFVAAAGNGGFDNDINPQYPSGYTSSNIISVASSDHNDARSGFSQWGATSVDLFAPGSDILSSIPGDDYAKFNGTSMATPYVSGAAALLWSTLNSPIAPDVKSTLMTTVDHVSVLTGLVVSNGRLNLHKALSCDPNEVVFDARQQDGFKAYQSVQTVLTTTLTNCAPITNATVTASFSNGDATVVLHDNGVAPDVLANDGMYTAYWTPAGLGAVTINYLSDYNGSQYTLQRNGTVEEHILYQVNDQYAYDWVDISSTGINMNLSDDSYYFPIDFDFNFYGTDYSRIAVGSNGGVYFQDSYLTFGNAEIPSTVLNGITSLIALMWDDLNPSAGGAVYYEIQGTSPSRKLIIQYNDIPIFGGNNGASFQVILNESNGDILMQYLDVDFGDGDYNRGASATIGLQHTSDFAQQYSYNEVKVRDEQAILWSPIEPDPAITLPVNGSTLAGTDVTFEFAGPDTVTNWWVYIGSSAGRNDYYNSGLLGANADSIAVSGLPSDGSTVYATLWYKVGAIWESVNSSYSAYTEVIIVPEITSPANGSTLSGSDVTFEFTGGGTVNNWWIYIGSSAGGSDYYDSGRLSANTESVDVTGLPTDGSTVYATLWYKDNTGSGWQRVESSYTAISYNVPEITSPANGATLSGSNVNFEFTGPDTVTSWQVLIGSTVSGSDYYDSGILGSNAETVNVTNLPTDGSTVYATLRYQNGVDWQSVDSSYTAYTVVIIDPEITSPVNGSTLSGSNVTFEFTGSDTVDSWQVLIGSTAGGSEYYDSGLLGANAESVDVTNLPTDGSTVYATLRYRMGGDWQSVDYSYTAIFYSTPEITSPANGATLSGSDVTFEFTGPEVVTFWQVLIGSTVSGSEYYDSSLLGANVESVDVTGLPTDGSTVYATLRYKIGDDWQSVDSSYVAADQLSGDPVITSPEPGTTLTGSREVFSWTENEADVRAWWLMVGSSEGSSDIYSSYLGSASSTTVTNLPTDGGTVYVRLWYNIGVWQWQYGDFIYTASSGEFE